MDLDLTLNKLIDAKTDEIKGTLEDEQRVIDTLASRSLKHESEIKDFKRILKNQGADSSFFLPAGPPLAQENRHP